MTRKRFICRIKDGIKFTSAVLILLGLMTATWLQIGLPIPATADDVRRLDRSQLQTAIKVQLQIETRLDDKIFDLEWKLNQLQAKKNATDSDKIMERMLLKKIRERKSMKDMETAERVAYKDQLIRLKAVKE